jgi:hypothetical protein
LETLGEFLLAIGIGGGIGGLLFGYRQSGLRLPSYSQVDHRLSAGFFADAIFGIAGGLVVFLIVPIDFSLKGDTEKTVKFFALCVLGGYAGPALLETVIKNTLKDVQEEQKRIKDDVGRQLDIIRNHEEQTRKDSRALYVVDHYLNDTESDLFSIDVLAEVVKAASEGAQLEIYQRARSVRRRSWNFDKAALSRTIPIFETLTTVWKLDRERHRLIAQLAYAYKDNEPPDYERALTLLDEAILLRKKENLQPSAWYHFNRAFCMIALDAAGQRKISNNDMLELIKDLDIAQNNPTMVSAIADSKLVSGWLAFHRPNAATAV